MLVFGFMNFGVSQASCFPIKEEDPLMTLHWLFHAQTESDSDHLISFSPRKRISEIEKIFTKTWSNSFNFCCVVLKQDTSLCHTASRINR